MHDAKIRRIAVKLFEAAKEKAERSRITFPRLRDYLYEDIDDKPHTEEDRLRAKAQVDKAAQEANQRASDHLSCLIELELKTREEPAVYRQCSNLPEEIASGLRYDDTCCSVYAIFKDRLYAMEGPFTDEEFALLTVQFFDREMRFFTKLGDRKRKLYSADHAVSRPKIASHIRKEVWNRDNGKCAACGSKEGLEYDHIIPFSKGGSSTARNLQLLCEVCNARKADDI